MEVLSLFDGMACGMLAMLEQGIKVDRYVAYEIDKYAIKTASHNFPMIEQRGDVFDADFTEFKGIDYLMGGSPCTYWSIAQKNNRETEASGMGWELFSQYVRALKEAQPKYFIYENNKSMSNAIRESITETFGFEPICINSALLSAQNRQRLYWVGKRNDDGTYSRVEIEQPEDRGILLKDILEDGLVEKDKAYCLKHQAGNARDYFKKHHTQIKFEPVAINTTDDGDKARTLMAGYYKYGTATLITNEGFKSGTTAVAEPVNSTSDNKSHTIKAQYYKNGIANFVCNGGVAASAVAEPVRIPDYGNEDKSRPVGTSYARKGSGEGSLACDCFPDNPNKQVFDYVAETVRVGSLPRPNGELSQSQAFRVSDIEGKSVNLTSGGGGAGGKTGLYAMPVNETVNNKAYALTASYYKCASNPCSEFGEEKRSPRVAEPIGFAIPCEWDENDKPIKAMSYADRKTYQVYEVKRGFITIKGKEYPIKLADGYYIIRKLTVRECMRLQTVPEWYEFPVSDTQAYKMLGNGWTVDIIAFLLGHTMGIN